MGGDGGHFAYPKGDRNSRWHGVVFPGCRLCRSKECTAPVGQASTINILVVAVVLDSSLRGAGVWSPAGGWWADPKHWRRNTAFAFM
jgi:hypothetical protein